MNNMTTLNNQSDALAWLSAPVDLSFPESQPQACRGRQSIDGGVKRHCCGTCGAKFREKKNLIAHTEEVHHKKRRFACVHSHCPVVSNRRYNMSRHMRLMHTKPCQTPCAACEPPAWDDVAALADVSEVTMLFDSIL